MNNIVIGAIGEQFAARYLREEGYNILSSNFKANQGELDLVAEDKKNICFIEVKTRQAGGMFRPSSAVDFRKQENVKSAAAAFLNLKKTRKAPRYDIIEVIVDGREVVEFKHIKNAF